MEDASPCLFVVTVFQLTGEKLLIILCKVVVLYSQEVSYGKGSFVVQPYRHLFSCSDR